MADTDPLKKRLAQLQHEHEAGIRALQDIDQRRAVLCETMLRIEGAAAVLRELIDSAEKTPPPPAEPGRKDVFPSPVPSADNGAAPATTGPHPPSPEA